MSPTTLLGLIVIFQTAILVWALFKLEDLEERVNLIDRHGVFILPPDPPTGGRKGGRWRN